MSNLAKLGVNLYNKGRDKLYQYSNSLLQPFADLIPLEKETWSFEKAQKNLTWIFNSFKYKVLLLTVSQLILYEGALYYMFRPKALNKTAIVCYSIILVSFIVKISYLYSRQHCIREKIKLTNELDKAGKDGRKTKFFIKAKDFVNTIQQINASTPAEEMISGVPTVIFCGIFFCHSLYNKNQSTTLFVWLIPLALSIVYGKLFNEYRAQSGKKFNFFNIQKILVKKPLILEQPPLPLQSISIEKVPLIEISSNKVVLQS